MIKLRHLLLASACLSTPLISQAYELIGPTWPSGDVTFHTSVSGSSPSGVSWNTAMQEAANKWASSVNGLQVSFDNSSAHPCAGILPEYPEDGNKNSFGFFNKACNEDFGENVIAVTFSWNIGSNYTESDIVFNTAENWNVYDGNQRSSLDFRRVAVHEFGHLIGLDHESSNSAIMAPLIGNIYNPTSDDLNGARSMYDASSSSGGSSSSSGGSTSSSSTSSSGGSTSSGSSSSSSGGSTSS
ncbi:MAG: matrixin family metalloprotease, partial [Cellvibrionaceae bacterium]|nr:matrixin family metalloprotease [Cellvibrionaceae bacterium]